MRNVFLALVLGLAAAALTACEQEGPMEQAGEDIDQAAENVGEAAEDAGDD